MLFVLIISSLLHELVAGAGLRSASPATYSNSAFTSLGTTSRESPPRPVLPGTNNNPSKKYLISTFPQIKQVAYLHLPDTVWRPLCVGDVSDPRGLAVDSVHQRVFVADHKVGKIFWYTVIVQPDGLLKTDGQQHVAVEGYTAYWMSTNGVGDLYFTGVQSNITAPGEVYPAVYRMDGTKISIGDALSPVEVYSRSNTGSPNPTVWSPSGIAVDSFNIYWGNEEKGTTNGAVCKGTRQNIGKTSGITTTILSEQVAEVRGMAVTGETLFFLSPNGLFALPKTQASPVTDSVAGMIIQPPNGDTNTDKWDPRSIAYDGDGTLYFTDASLGVIYSIPSGQTALYPLVKFVDAPQAFGVQIMSLTGQPASMSESITAGVEDEKGAQSGTFWNARIPGSLMLCVVGLTWTIGIASS